MPNNYIDCAHVLKGLLDRWSIVQSTLPKSSFFNIDLETLIEHKESTLREVCKFSKLPFEKSLLELKLNKSGLGRFKKELNKSDRMYVEKILFPYIEKD